MAFEKMRMAVGVVESLACYQLKTY